jgi:hypothetical protein
MIRPTTAGAMPQRVVSTSGSSGIENSLFWPHLVHYVKSFDAGIDLCQPQNEVQ